MSLTGSSASDLPPAVDRAAIAWLIHFDDAESQLSYRRLADQAAQWGQVLQFRDGIGLSPGESPAEIVVLSEREIRNASPRRYNQWRRSMMSGAYAGGFADMVLMAITARLRSYDYVWIIEYDVDFTGDWSDFFREFADCKADLLGTNLYGYSQSLQWYHWSSFVCPEQTDPKFFTRGFFPVVRFSRRFLEVYRREMERFDWEGHYEAIWPTIALHAGLTVEDIGGLGPFVPPNRRGKWYMGDNEPELTKGTFRHRPAVAERFFPNSDVELPPNHLCHPIKTAARRSRPDIPARHRKKYDLMRMISDRFGF